MSLKRFGAFLLSLITVFSTICLLPIGITAKAYAEGEILLTATSGAIELSSAEDLMQLVTNPNGSFVLTNDIDMSGIDWTPAAFSGTLDGAGHTIYNLKVTRTGSARADTLDGNRKVYDSVFAGFFSTIINAQIKDLNLRGVDIEIESSEHCFVGTIAGYMNNSTVSGCTITDARATIIPTIQPDPLNPRTSCNAGVGGIIGFATSGTMDGCTANTVLVFDDHCFWELKVEEFMGGALSCGNASVTNSSIVIDGYDACRGYVHNGGLVGMFYQFSDTDELGTLSECDVKGMITFFEDNPDRRAYCEAYVGEYMTWPYLGENTESFTRNEIMDYSAKLYPEKCALPSLTEAVMENSCTDCGYTTHTCSVCGNTWRDSFTLPEHVPGEWIVASDPKNGVDGIRKLSCSRCGETLEEEILKAVQSIALDSTALEMNYKDDAKLSARTVPSDAADQHISWRSSNEKVATVDNNGNIRAVGRGSAEITAASADGYASNKCSVKVDYTFKQWVIKILLFGWIWY